jgi:hypothetical protein
MVLVEVDIVRLEPLKAPLESSPDLPAGASPFSGRPAELRREHNAVASPAKGLSKVRLALSSAVALCGIEERDAGLERCVDDRARPRLVDTAAEVVAAEANDGDLERAERPRSHGTRVTIGDSFARTAA